MYISTYFHVYFYLFLHIYLDLPQKCGILLQFTTKVWYYCTTILTKVSDRKPGAFGHFYMSDRKATVSGANLALKVVLRKIHTFVAYLKKKLKNLTTPIFLVGLIYRWGKGPKFKNI